MSIAIPHTLGTVKTSWLTQSQRHCLLLDAHTTNSCHAVLGCTIRKLNETGEIQEEIRRRKKPRQFEIETAVRVEAPNKRHTVRWTRCDIAHHQKLVTDLPGSATQYLTCIYSSTCTWLCNQHGSWVNCRQAFISLHLQKQTVNTVPADVYMQAPAQHCASCV